MHFHHKHDIDGCTDTHDEWTDADRTILATLDRLGYILMSAQSDALTAIGEQLAAIEAGVAVLKDAKANAPAPEALDFGPVQAQVSSILADVQSLLPLPVLPELPAPADAPVVLDAPAPAADPAPADAAPVDTTVIPAQSIPSVPLA